MSTSNDQPQPPQQEEAVAANGHPHPLHSHPVTTGRETTSSTGNAASESSQPTLLSAHLASADEEGRTELEAAWEAAGTRGGNAKLETSYPTSTDLISESPPTPTPSSTDSDASIAPDHRDDATVNGATDSQTPRNSRVEATSIEDILPEATEEEREWLNRW